MFSKRVGEIVRRTALKRGAPLRRKVPIKRGAPSPFRERVKSLHRACVMLRAGAHVRAKTFRAVSWAGPCERCRRIGSLVVSHVYGQGAHRSAAFLSLNATAMCAPCHDWWHANPLEAAAWIRAHRGADLTRELEAVIALARKVNLPHDAALLVDEIRRRGLHENDVIPEGAWAA